VDGVSAQKINATTADQSVSIRTVNGIPVSSLPIEVANLITYSMTDQGIAEANASKLDSKGRPHSGVQVLINEGFDQQIRRRAAAEDIEDSEDPLLDARNKYNQPGFRYRGLSPTVIRKKGMRNWEAVMDSRGEPVTAGNLILAKMPIERAEKRNKKYRDEGNSAAANAREQLQTDHEQAVFNSNQRGDGSVRILQAGETMSQYDDPSRRISIGVRSSRGDQGADAAG
jgi:hypothetical protein